LHPLNIDYGVDATIDNIHKYNLHFSGGNIMLSTELQKESMINRIEKIVAILMEERPLFKEELDAEKMIQHLCNIFQKNLSIGEFNLMEDQDLKNRCSGILSVEMLSGLLDDLTPEQIAIFDEAVKRK
jgi:hypothetical protein